MSYKRNETPKALRRARVLWTLIFAGALFGIVLVFSLITLRFHKSNMMNRIDSRLLQFSNLSNRITDQLKKEDAPPPFLFEEGVGIQLYDANARLRAAVGVQFPKGLKRIKDGPLKSKEMFSTLKFVTPDDEIKVFRVLQRPLPGKLPFLAHLKVGMDIGQTLENRAAFVRGIVIFILIFPLAAGLLGYFLAGLILKPVQANYQLLKRFSFDASHELKTPLTVIKMSTGMLLSKKESLPEDAVKKIETIDRSNQRMDSLVKQLLQLAKAHNMTKDIATMEKINLKAFIPEVREDFRAYASSKNLTFEITTVDDVEITANREALRTIVSNIVDNAVKFSPEGGIITLSTQREEKETAIFIRDNGPGIAEQDREKIFDRFYKADKSRHDTKGSGMGLSIAKEFAEETGIRIDLVESSEKGSVFKVRVFEIKR